MVDDVSSPVKFDQKIKVSERDYVAVNPSMALHSGTPDISIKQWAILLRCKACQPVTVEAIMNAASDWFLPSALSLPEVIGTMNILIERGWVYFDAEKQTALATTDCLAVIACLELPVTRADGWNMFAAWRSDTDMSVGAEEKA